MSCLKGLGSPFKGKTPFFIIFMKELSVFVDESGDFGEYNHHAPYYIIAMVFHKQENSIAEDIEKSCI